MSNDRLILIDDVPKNVQALWKHHNEKAAGAYDQEGEPTKIIENIHGEKWVGSNRARTKAFISSLPARPMRRVELEAALAKTLTNKPTKTNAMARKRKQSTTGVLLPVMTDLLPVYSMDQQP